MGERHSEAVCDLACHSTGRWRSKKKAEPYLEDVVSTRPTRLLDWNPLLLGASNNSRSWLLGRLALELDDEEKRLNPEVRKSMGGGDIFGSKGSVSGELLESPALGYGKKELDSSPKPNEYLGLSLDE